MITVAASRLKSFEKEKHAAMSYICLCRIFRTVLMMHRTKLGGRHHLVVSALQMLLQCLYIPYTKEQKVSAAKRENSMFGEDHAAAYCGLLTMICDPSVSAVTRARKRPQQQELNDLTQKARSIAGQHLHYLIMEYCQCQLKGSLRPGMKKALTPGLYAILNVMSQDVKQTMNAALDASSRSVFKALYEDYRRFGKWQGT